MSIMNKGKIVESGKTSDIMNNANNQYTKKLLSSVPAIIK